MDAARWREIKEIFAEAVDRTPDERTELLSRVAERDPALRDEVLALLRSHEAAAEGGLFDTPVLDEMRVRKAREDAPEYVGSYRLIRPLGRGGMGTVYLAERADSSFRKMAAVKLIRRGMDSDDILLRFRFERQILAALDHENIARLLDGGASEDGRPYIVMEYVEGVPLHEYCDGKRMTVGERIRLFRTVCSAVQYAHRNLVIHRDLKPQNILVRADGTVKLLDFGIAKLLDSSTIGTGAVPVTNAGHRVMTPDYASPEQISGGPVTTASDVYSLGVILYELLTGRRPYRLKPTTAADAERIITEATPERPSTAVVRSHEPSAGSSPDAVAAMRQTQPARLRRRLSGDLDNITLMALRKEPGRRYPSVEQLSEDLRRHLEGLPVTARGDDLAYRTSRFLKRHKLETVASALVILTLIAAMVGIAWQARVAAAERDRAQTEAAKASRINTFLQGMLASADPFNLGRQVAVVDVLSEAARRIDVELSEEGEVAASVHLTLATTYRGLGELDSAEVHARRALQLNRDLWDEGHVDVARSLQVLGGIRFDQGSYDEGEAHLRRAIEIYGRQSEADSVALAEAWNDLAQLLRNKGQDEEARRLYGNVLRVYRRHLEPSDLRLARALNDLAVLLGSGTALREAEALHRESLAIVRRHYPGTHPTVAAALSTLASNLDAQKEYGRAEPLYREALAMKQTIYGEDHVEMLPTMINLANMLRLKGDFAAGEQLARKSLKLAADELPEGHPLTAYATLVLGRALCEGGNAAQGEGPLRTGLAMRRALLPETHFLIASAESALGGCLLELGRFREAEPLLLGSYERLRTDRGEQHEYTQETLGRIVRLYESQNRAAEAATYRARLAVE